MNAPSIAMTVLGGKICVSLYKNADDDFVIIYVFDGHIKYERLFGSSHKQALDFYKQILMCVLDNGCIDNKLSELFE